MKFPYATLWYMDKLNEKKLILRIIYFSLYALLIFQLIKKIIFNFQIKLETETLNEREIRKQTHLSLGKNIPIFVLFIIVITFLYSFKTIFKVPRYILSEIQWKINQIGLCLGLKFKQFHCRIFGNDGERKIDCKLS